ncbi:hypothetical protein GF362_02655 [Candidatus Dojkabacteria bacterium]|nr:hypothetical protein [Candidatus Dojkabacteria bacterium]
MNFFRSLLKRILLTLAKSAIKKHSIEFVVVVGWYGTNLVREGIYELLSDKFTVRRNTDNIWWDLSIPLVILGYEDKRYNPLQWFLMIVRSCSALLINSPNPHKIVLNINLADEDTSEYWSKIVVPEIVVVTSYKKKRSFLIHKLIRKSKAYEGKIVISDKISSKELSKYPKFGYRYKKRKEIKTPKKTYKIKSKIQPIYLEIFAPIIAVAEYYQVKEEEIVDSLIKLNIVDKITQKMKHAIGIQYKSQDNL